MNIDENELPVKMFHRKLPDRYGQRNLKVQLNELLKDIN